MSQLLINWVYFYWHVPINLTLAEQTEKLKNIFYLLELRIIEEVKIISGGSVIIWGVWNIQLVFIAREQYWVCRKGRAAQLEEVWYDVRSGARDAATNDGAFFLLLLLEWIIRIFGKWNWRKWWRIRNSGLHLYLSLGLLLSR